MISGIGSLFPSLTSPRRGTPTEVVPPTMAFDAQMDRNPHTPKQPDKQPPHRTLAAAAQAAMPHLLTPKTTDALNQLATIYSRPRGYVAPAQQEPAEPAIDLTAFPEGQAATGAIQFKFPDQLTAFKALPHIQKLNAMGAKNVGTDKEGVPIVVMSRMTVCDTHIVIYVASNNAAALQAELTKMVAKAESLGGTKTSQTMNLMSPEQYAKMLDRQSDTPRPGRSTIPSGYTLGGRAA